MFKFIIINQLSEPPSKEVFSFVFRALAMLIIWIFLDQILTIDLGIMYSLQHQGIIILNKVTHLNYHATQVYLTENRPKFGLVCENSWLNVGKTCDGKSLMFMYLSFICIYPNIQLKSRLIYGLLGMALIHEFNVIRIVLLSIILQYKPKYFPLMHHYFFQVLMYVIIFLLVRQYLKNQSENATQKR
jgi:exosortase/archaeosortase family protein